MDVDIAALTDRVRQDSLSVRRIEEEMSKVIVGQKAMINRLLVGMLTRGHVLVEGVPGLAKTLAVRTLGAVLDLHFSRIQFTPDLLPADLIGTMVFNPKLSEFHPRKGPIFANLVLADEINRAPAKVQSALLEAMQDRQVTIGDTTYPLEEPFLVMATQNPIEHEGTYPLPEAQVDRFMLKLKITYPSREEELGILDRMSSSEEIPLAKIATRARLIEARQTVEKIYVDAKIKSYIVSLVFATREPQSAGMPDLKDLIAYGASPRATLALAAGARALAFLEGRGFVIPEDVKEIARDVLRHRIILTYEAEAEEVTSDDLVTRVLDRIEVP